MVAQVEIEDNLLELDGSEVSTIVDTIDGEDPFPKDAFSAEQRRSGALILHIIGILYVTRGMALVTINFFVPSLEVIMKKIKINPEVTGALFLVVGLSLPEIILSVIGQFVAFNDIAYGKIVGSSVFNNLFVIGVACLFVKEKLRLKKCPVFRDMLFYIFSILLLFSFFLDEMITWYEALILLVVYGTYVIVMIFNDKLEMKLSGCCKAREESTEESQPEDAQEEEDPPIHIGLPKGNIGQQILYILSFPALFLLYVTLPDVNNKHYTIFPSLRIPGVKFFIWTFVGSIIWIHVLSYLVVWWTSIVGVTIGIPPEVMGLTIVAVCTNIPFITSLVVLSRKGKGNLAISAAIGCNIFHVAIALPLPWLFFTLIKSTSVPVVAEGMVCSVAILLLMICLFFLSILIFKWKMTKIMGILLLLLYFFFVAVSLGFQYDYIMCPVGPASRGPPGAIPGLSNIIT